MPFDRFFNLPEEKRMRIINASIKEFGRVGFDEISINQIIQDAGISRGSFYQYFEDKNDLQSYLLKDFTDQIKKHLDEYVHQNRGNLIQFFTEAFETLIKIGRDTGCYVVCKNVFSQLKYGHPFFENLIFQIHEDDTVAKIYTYMKENFYPDVPDEYLQLSWEIMWSQFKECIALIIVVEKPVEEIKARLEKTLLLIEAGMKMSEKENLNV